MEDRCRRNNVRLVGLPEGMEGPDAAGFLRANLSKWIPSLRGRDIEIDRGITCMTEGGAPIGHYSSSCTRWHDRSNPEGAGRLIREMRTEQCHTAIFS